MPDGALAATGAPGARRDGARPGAVAGAGAAAVTTIGGGRAIRRAVAARAVVGAVTTIGGGRAGAIRRVATIVGVDRGQDVGAARAARDDHRAAGIGADRRGRRRRSRPPAP
ncbi:MAG: hypothetical protein H6708_01715 [Kofleriaceae bacterium]|nr:hypothetical protein [Kofleriaceae bacterium]